MVHRKIGRSERLVGGIVLHSERLCLPLDLIHESRQVVKMMISKVFRMIINGTIWTQTVHNQDGPQD